MAISLSTFRSGRFLKFAALPAAVIAGGLVIGNASYSAYSDTTTNPTNNWTTGTVKLVDDDGNTALFSASNLKPGQTTTRCITVTSSGSLDSTVKLFATATPAATSTKDLAANLNLTITQGTGATNAACAGFTALTTPTPAAYSGTLAAFGSTYTGFSNGFGDWAPTGSASESRSYKIVTTVNPQADNTTQGGSASLGFTWEAQNAAPAN